jgi:ketosteroid isomerase-like protein
MSNSDLIRKYFSAYENKDRKAVESLLSDDFVFTSPYDNRIDRETYFKRCWPYSEQSPTYEIEKVLEGDNEAFILYDCKTKTGGRSRNTEFFTIEGNKIREVEVYFGSVPTKNQRKQRLQKSLLRLNPASFECSL